MADVYIKKSGWLLLHITNRTPVRYFEKLHHERDYKPAFIEGGRPPQHENSSGRIWVKYQDGSTGEYFPHVYGMRWEMSVEDCPKRSPTDRGQVN